MFGSKRIRGALAGLAACGALLLAGCGADGMSGLGSPPGAANVPAACSGSSCGPAMLTMTDAKGDFLS